MSTTRRRPRIGADSAHSWARNLTLGNPHAKAVLMALCFYVNDEGACFCSISTLAQDTDLSENTVRSRLRWLDDIGAIVRIPQWLDEHGRRTYIVGGKRTSDEIKLLLDEDADTIEDRARNKENPPNKDAVSPPPQVGLNSDPETVSPAPALQQPSTSTEGLDSSEVELEDSPPTPPSGGGQKTIPDDKRASFERFSKTFPAPIVDYEATLKLWAAMSDPDTEDAIKGARGYRDYLADLAAQKRSRNVRDAHRWLKNRQWMGFLGTPGAKRGDESPAPIWVAEGSAEAAAWAVFNRICGHENRFTQGRMLVPSEWPPPVGDGSGEWVHAVEGTGQYAAWMRRLREGPPRTIGLRNVGNGKRGLLVPSEWPPNKTVAGTLMTEEDQREFAG
jgi:Helix-turn-helix domain